MLYTKYKPTRLKDIKHNKSLTDALLSIDSNSNNYIIYGVDGTGKNTILMAYINSIFNNDNLIYETKYTNIDLVLNNNTISIDIISSSHHFEINCEDFSDKRIVNSFIKMISNTYNINNNKKKIVIIKHLELLNIEYQWMLRRTIENVYKTCRIFFITNNISKIDNSITSRCICLRTELPTTDEITIILEHIVEKENIAVNKQQIEKIIKNSNRNLSTCLVMLEYSNRDKKSKKTNNIINIFINKLITKINNSTNLDNILEIRDSIHFVVLYDINLNIFFCSLYDFFINSDLDYNKKLLILKVISNNNYTIQLASKKLYHLECLVCNIIFILNTKELNNINNVINFY